MKHLQRTTSYLLHPDNLIRLIKPERVTAQTRWVQRCWFSPRPAVCDSEELTRQPECASVAFTDESETPKFSRCWRLAVSCRLSSSWQLFTRSDSQAKVAQWYVYWEALDNRKGGGCCWNVTIIDKKKTQKKEIKKETRKIKKNKNMDRNWLILTRTRAATCAPRKTWEKNSQQCTGRDVITVFTKLILTGK